MFQGEDGSRHELVADAGLSNLEGVSDLASLLRLFDSGRVRIVLVKGKAAPTRKSGLWVDEPHGVFNHSLGWPSVKLAEHEVV